MKQKIIMLIDMNSFFASVHQALDPSLQHKPVIVCGDPAKRHGIVLAASYEAKRPYGIKTGMTVSEARQKCPGAIFISPQYRSYVDFSTRILNILQDYSPLVEPYSIDEAFIDITGCINLLGKPQQIAKNIKGDIANQIGIMCSVGIGPNKLLAKMAADFEKPDGLTVLTAEDIPDKLWPLPVRELFGVGSRYEKHFRKLNIKTIGDLAHFPLEILKKKFGLMGEILHLSANGIDYSPVEPSNMEYIKSIGNQITLPRDYSGFDEIKVIVLELAEQICHRARAVNSLGKTVSLTLKDNYFITRSHATTMPQPSNITNEVYQAALEIMKTHWGKNARVRAVGLTLSNLTDNKSRQLRIDNDIIKQEELEKACDAIKTRWGYGAIKRATSLTDLGGYYERKENR
ncbi:MAG: DNA polymerase IV [Firmicutes bacterium]|nr:DNA polymerase IV [Bacillota bacterium]